MELKLDFKQFMLQEADAQKAKENNDMKSKDASHGNKADVLDTKVKADTNNYEGDKVDKLDPSINEEADAQKAKENADNKKRDASHGDKADVLDPSINETKEVLHGDCDDDEDDKFEKELDESAALFEASEDIKGIIAENSSRKPGQKILIKGEEIDKSYILRASKYELTYYKTTASQYIVYSLDSNEKNVVYLAKSDIKNFK